MYNDTIKVANKIIPSDDLYEIFSMMNEKLIYYKKVFETETMKNKLLNYDCQSWTFKDSGSTLTFEVDFYDDTIIKFDNCNNFLAIFNSRLPEIKRIYVHFNLSYSVFNNKKIEYYNQRINMWISETKIDIDVALSSVDKKIDDVYELIKNKILNAKEKYDVTVKKKGLINLVVGFTKGFIPALLISILFLLSPTLCYIFAASYVLYPICILIITLFIGKTFGTTKLDNLYQNIIPEQKYTGYDYNKGRSIYKDDVDKYVKTSEILIGKNVDNLKKREEIMKYYNKCKMFLPYELVILIILSIVVLFLK